MWRGDVRLSMSVSAPFVWRRLSGSAVAPFPHPAHRTGHADFPHPALGQDFTPSSRATPTAAADRRAQQQRLDAAVILQGRTNRRRRIPGGSTISLCATARDFLARKAHRSSGDQALKTELAGVAEDEFAIAGLMAVELDAERVCD
jgi:hypothetical protein